MDIGLDASNARGTLTRFDLRDEPLSKPINDQILAEDFTEAESSCRSVFFTNRYYLVFVGGGVTRVYIFNTLMGAWESRDEYKFGLLDFVRAKTKFDRNEQLCRVQTPGNYFGWMKVMMIQENQSSGVLIQERMIIRTLK